MIMFPEIEGGTHMQPKIIGGTWEKMFENPCSSCMIVGSLSADHLLLSGSSPTISEKANSMVAMATHLPPATIHPSAASSSVTSLAAIGAIEQKLWTQLEDVSGDNLGSR